MQQCTLVRMHLGAYRVYYNEGLKTDEEAKCFFAVILDVLYWSNRGNRGLCCAKYSDIPESNPTDYFHECVPWRCSLSQHLKTFHNNSQTLSEPSIPFWLLFDFLSPGQATIQILLRCIHLGWTYSCQTLHPLVSSPTVAHCLTNHASKRHPGFIMFYLPIRGNSRENEWWLKKCLLYRFCKTQVDVADNQRSYPITSFACTGGKPWSLSLSLRTQENPEGRGNPLTSTSWRHL